MRLEPLCLWVSCHFFVQTRRKCCTAVDFHQRCAVCMHSLYLLQRYVRVQVRIGTPPHTRAYVHSLGATVSAISFAVLFQWLNIFFNIIIVVGFSRFSLSLASFSTICSCVCACVRARAVFFIHHFKKSKCIWWLLFSLCFSFKHLTNTLLVAAFKCISALKTYIKIARVYNLKWLWFRKWFFLLLLIIRCGYCFVVALVYNSISFGFSNVRKQTKSVAFARRDNGISLLMYICIKISNVYTLRLLSMPEYVFVCVCFWRIFFQEN